MNIDLNLFIPDYRKMLESKYFDSTPLNQPIDNSYVKRYDHIKPIWPTQNDNKSDTNISNDDINTEIDNTSNQQESIPVNDAFNKLDYTGKVKHTFNWFKQNTNYTDKQIAGMMAIIENESAFKPDAINKMEAQKWTGENEYKPGRGLLQWSLDRNLNFKDWYKNKYKKDQGIWASNASVEDQLEFMLHEMSQRPAFLSAMANTTTVEEAADIMRRGFENGSAHALATKKDLDRYTKVGSPDADGFAMRDNEAANRIYNIYNTTQEA